MTSGGSPLLSVRAEARQLVAPDYAVVDGMIEHTARSKVEAMRSVTDSLDRLTANLAALGAVPFDEGRGAPPADVVGVFLHPPVRSSTTIRKPCGWSGPGR